MSIDNDGTVTTKMKAYYKSYYYMILFRSGAGFGGLAAGRRQHSQPGRLRYGGRAAARPLPPTRVDGVALRLHLAARRLRWPESELLWRAQPRLRRPQPANPKGIESFSPALTVRACPARRGYAGSTPQSRFNSNGVAFPLRTRRGNHFRVEEFKGMLTQGSFATLG